jgi:hypothetical protein
MSTSKFSTRLILAAAALAWAGGAADAADVPPPPPVVVGAAPVTVGEAPGCATCQQGGLFKGHRSTCDKLLHKKGPYPVHLCPGACFGYFQTQWRKWDEVCPYPYLGVGVGDAARPPGGVLHPRPGEILTPPRPVDPKMTDPKMPDPKKVGGTPNTLPPIPPVMTSKFYP